MAGARPLGRALQVGLVVGLGLLLVLAGIVLLLQTRWGGRAIANLIEDRFSEAVAGRLSIGYLDIDGTTLEANGILLFDPRGTRVGRLERLELDFRLLPLLRRQLVIDRLELVRPQVELHPGAERRGVAAALRPARPAERERASAWAIRVERLRIRQGLVRSTLPGETPVAVEVAEIDVRGDGHYRSQPRDLAVAVRLQGTSRGPVAGPLELTAQGSIHGTRRSGRAELRLRDQLEASARLSDETLSLDIRRLVLAPALVRPWLPGWPIDRAVTLGGQARVGTAKISGRLEAEVRGIPGWAAVQGSLDRDFERSPDGLELRVHDLSPARLVGRGPDVPVRGMVRLDPGSLAPDRLAATVAVYAPAVRWRGARWGPLRLAARVDGGEIEGLEGRLALPGGRLSLTDGDEAGAWLEGRVVVRDLRRISAALAGLAGASPPPLGGSGWLRFVLLGRPLRGLEQTGLAFSGRWPRLVVSGLATGGLRLQGRLPTAVAGARPFHLSIRALDQQAPGLRLSGRRLPGQRGETLVARIDSLRLRYQSLAGPLGWRLHGDAWARLGVDSWSLSGLDLRAGRQRIALDLRGQSGRVGGRLEVAALAGTSAPAVLADRNRNPRWRRWRIDEAALDAVYHQERADGTLRLAAGPSRFQVRFDLPAGWPPPVGATLDLRATLEGAELAGLMPLPPRTSLRGRVSARAQLGGTTSAPRLALSAQAAGLDVRARGADGAAATPFAGTGQLALAYRDQVLRASLDLEGSDGGRLLAEAHMVAHLALSRLARGGARLALTRRPITGEIHLRNFPTGWLAAVLPQLRLMRGRALADLRLEGTLAAPEIDGQVGLRQGRAVLGSRRRP